MDGSVTTVDRARRSEGTAQPIQRELCGMSLAGARSGEFDHRHGTESQNPRDQFPCPGHLALDVCESGSFQTRWCSASSSKADLRPAANIDHEHSRRDQCCQLGSAELLEKVVEEYCVEFGQRRAMATVRIVAR